VTDNSGQNEAALVKNAERKEAGRRNVVGARTALLLKGGEKMGVSVGKNLEVSDVSAKGVMGPGTTAWKGGGG